MSISRGITLAEARRIALAAQGFDRPRPARVQAGQIRGVIHRLGLLQLDFVNVLTPAHHLVLFSRLGPYALPLFRDTVYGGGQFTEQWAHEASIVPVSTWPLLRHRMQKHRVRPYPFDAFIRRHPDYADHVLEAVRVRGALSADDLEPPDGVDRRMPGTWVGTVPRAMLEAHFGRGLLAVTERRQNFSRLYDLAERVLPAEHHSRQIEAADAQRELLRLAACAHGIATTADLADYYRMPIREAHPRLAELAEAGVIVEVEVDGRRAWLHQDARSPREIDAAAILAPFDPVVWYRPRAAWLFGFDYRLEIFVPKPRRRWGYYVLPFLFRERLAARVDLKAERAAGRLDVLAAYAEPGCAPGDVAEALAAELRLLAGWLGLESVGVSRRGNLARLLAAAI